MNNILKLIIFHFIATSILLLSSCMCNFENKNKVAINIDNSYYIQRDIFHKSDYDSLLAIKDVFDLSEQNVANSPDSSTSLKISEKETVIDYAISPSGSIAAILIKNDDSSCNLKIWDISQATVSDSFQVVGYNTSYIAWHPRATGLFVIGTKDKEHHILKIDKTNENWNIRSIYSYPGEIKRLVVCPRPFNVGYDNEKQVNFYSYRIFFGIAYENDRYRVVSVTENGNRFYQVIGPSNSITVFEDADIPPSEIESNWALPVAFHPAGHELIWENKKGNFLVSVYDQVYWDKKSYSLTANEINSGTVTPVPNGLGFIIWKNNQSGINLVLSAENKKQLLAKEYKFAHSPAIVPDGKGVVALTLEGKDQFLRYIPVNIPLADVTNAWMFVQTKAELDLFMKNYGLFRTNIFDQLYKLYETENYYCDHEYDRRIPTRPYLVTTDVFWEFFAAAYEGLFIVKEREDAIPEFWYFVESANEYYKSHENKSPWAPVFKTLVDLKNDVNNPEVAKIKSAEGTSYSDIFKHEYDYSILKSRGHYTASKEAEKYFKAFKYLTTAFSNEKVTKEQLNKLPSEIKSSALNWLRSYMNFISPSRSPLVFKDIKFDPIPYNHYPLKDPRIFPLSWGFDNEVLYSTVYHMDSPPDLQVTGPGGMRLVPSGLDLVSALGNTYADLLLAEEYTRYPPLKRVIEKLKDNFKKNGRSASKNENLYDRWITALAVQWADTVKSPAGSRDKDLWQIKRIQTGLASWATLRHATVLVNETTAAECGEGGFEEILMTAPRGYVEPDPYTFEAIAGLFEAIAQLISKNNSSQKTDAKNPSIDDGINKRLNEAAQDARMFKTIAEKELKGEPLTSKEYESILYTGRFAEHYFLIFKSLANTEFALSKPDPMAKIAEVSGGGEYKIPYLMAAVGNSLEWNNVVPYFGRKQIVKGSVYSYYEFESEQLINDEEWRNRVKTQDYMSWLKPYLTENPGSFPAATGYCRY